MAPRQICQELLTYGMDQDGDFTSLDVALLQTPVNRMDELEIICIGLKYKMSG